MTGSVGIFNDYGARGLGFESNVRQGIVRLVVYKLVIIFCGLYHLAVLQTLFVITFYNFFCNAVFSVSILLLFSWSIIRVHVARYRTSIFKDMLLLLKALFLCAALRDIYICQINTSLEKTSWLTTKGWIGFGLDEENIQNCNI